MVFGGKIRAVMAYLDREKMQARGLSPLDVMKALDDYNVFLPTGDAKFGDTDYVIDSNSMFRNIADMGDIPLRVRIGPNAVYLRDVATPKDAASSRPTSSGSTAGARSTSRSTASSGRAR